MSTWPPGTITPWGATQLASGTLPNIWITSADGQHKFYIMGGLAPFPGVTDGVICTEHPKGLSPNFKHLDTNGARQDGVTWQGTVYDPAKITLKLDVHARSPQVLTQIMDEWMGAWNPRTPCTMEYITPDGGYWWAQVRLTPDSWQDAFKLTPRQLGVWSMTHNCRIDDAFWQTIPTVDNWGPTFASFSDNFGTNTSSGLSGSWTTTYSGSHTGFEYVSGGQVLWSDTGNSNQWVMNRYTTATETDNQVITITLGSSWEGITLFGGASTIIGGRMDTSGNGVFAELFWDHVRVYSVTSGTQNPNMMFTPLLSPPRPGESWSLICGSETGNPRTFEVHRSRGRIIRFTEPTATSVIGSTNRRTGFGGRTVMGGGLHGEAIPVLPSYFAGADNETTGTETDFVQLINVGTEDGWPSVLFYGPGTFTFGSITIGPLLDGQVVFMATLPRYQRLIDLTPGQPASPSSATESAVEKLVNDVFGKNIPLLVQDFESLFGVLPPQGSLQSLVSGQYVTPIPGVAIPSQATPTLIPVSVTSGNAASSVVASVTPRRIHPA